MNLLKQGRKIVTALILILVLTITTACGGGTVTQPDPRATAPVGRDVTYAQLEKGNTAAGQSFGAWVVETSKGLIQDAYVRDNNQLGVVISSEVSPKEVRPLAKSLVQGFEKNFPGQNLTVFLYRPDKKLILTAQYDRATNQIQYS
jgi:ABC-type phosphate transport system substrate-binding protein